MVRRTQMSVFDHFVVLALKGLIIKGYFVKS